MMNDTFIKHFWYNGFCANAPWPLMKDISEYCKVNYCRPISICTLDATQITTLLVVMEYKGSVSTKEYTEQKIPNTNKYYLKCSKCGFHLVEDEMTVCPGCASHFVGELNI